MTSYDDFEFSYTDPKPVPFWKQDILNFKRPQVMLVQGMRGSGKGVVVDKICEEYFKKGFLVVHCWGAADFENYFYAINKNCKVQWNNSRVFLNYLKNLNDDWITIDSSINHFQNEITKKDADELINQMITSKWIQIETETMKIQITTEGKNVLNHEPLHCNCSKALNITLVVPDYVDVDKKTLDRFNGVYWESWDNYNDDYIHQKTDLEICKAEYEFRYPDGLCKKPEKNILKPRILIRKITCPNSAKLKEIFREQWFSILNQSRSEQRILTVNPSIFNSPNDKFNTLEQIIRLIKDYSDIHCRKLTVKDVGKPEYDWTPRQKSYHKVLYAINELRSVSPSSALSGEKEVGKTKKALYSYIPEARHFNSWFIGDYQNPNDLYPSVRYQANIVIIKRASRELLGGDWIKLFDKIEKIREREFAKMDMIESMAPRNYIDRVNRKYPRIEELPDNRGYAVNPATDFRLIEIDTPSFHHKGDGDNFWSITGIKRSINKKKVLITSAPELEKGESKSINKKKVQNEIFEEMLILTDNGVKYNEILKKYQEKEEIGSIADIGLRNLNTRAFSTKFGRWKKSMKKSKEDKKQEK